MIIRPSDAEVLISGSVSDEPKAYVKESGKIKEKMLAAELRPNERKKIIGKSGNWMCECDGNNILYICCVEPEPDYPERLPKEMNNIASGHFQKLMEKYNDPKSFDSMSSVTSKVDLATKKMEDHMVTALQNQQDLKSTQARTDHLLAEAKELNENADELRQVMYWRNMKLKMIYGMMGSAASFSVVMPIIQKIFI